MSDGYHLLGHQTKDKTESCPDQTDKQQAEDEMGQNEAAGSTDCFHDGDGLLLFLQVSGQCRVNADAGQQQGKDTDKVEEEDKVVEKAFHSRRCGSIGIDALLNRICSRGEPVDQSGEVRGIGDFYQHRVADAAPFPNEIDALEVGGRYEDPWSECKRIQWSIGFLEHDVGNGQGSPSNGQRIPYPQSQSLQQNGCDNNAAGEQYFG